MELKGSRTEANLLAAFAGESQARNKYTYYASKAKKDGYVQIANIFEETIFEGKEIEVGDFIHVTYNGQMTFSIPAQIAAQKIGCYAHTGVVGEITEGQFTLETETESIIVNALEGQLEGISTGMTVTVYSNGAMTMSLPAQIGAEMITVTETIID